MTTRTLQLIPLICAIGRPVRTPRGMTIPGDHRYVVWITNPTRVLTS